MPLQSARRARNRPGRCADNWRPATLHAADAQLPGPPAYDNAYTLARCRSGRERYALAFCSWCTPLWLSFQLVQIVEQLAEGVDGVIRDNAIQLTVEMWRVDEHAEEACLVSPGNVVGWAVADEDSALWLNP